MEQRDPLVPGTIGDVASSLLDHLQRPPDEAERAYEALITLEELEVLLGEQPGYIRIGTSRDGLFYLRFKWTSGPLANRYTYGSAKSICAAATALQGNVQAVLAGKRRATEDKPPKR